MVQIKFEKSNRRVFAGNEIETANEKNKCHFYLKFGDERSNASARSQTKR